MADFNFVAPYLTMAQSAANAVPDMMKARAAIDLERAKIPTMQAEAALAQAQVPYAGQLAQSKLMGTPFEQQQAQIKNDMLREQMRRQQSLEQLKLRQEGDQNALQTWQAAMKAYETGIGPHPGPPPNLLGNNPNTAASQGFGMATGGGAASSSASSSIPSGTAPAKIQMPEDLMRLPPGLRNKALAQRIEEQPQAESALAEAISQLDRMADKAKNVREHDALANATGVVGLLARQLPGTQWKAIGADLESLKATNAFSMLNQLRSQSKTGGALGQVSNQEENMLANAVASIDPQMSVSDLKVRLKQYERFAAAAKERLRDAYKRTYGTEPNIKQYNTVNEPQTQLPITAGQPAPPSGVPADVWAVMTPQERSLWKK